MTGKPGRDLLNPGTMKKKTKTGFAIILALTLAFTLTLTGLAVWRQHHTMINGRSYRKLTQSQQARDITNAERFDTIARTYGTPYADPNTINDWSGQEAVTLTRTPPNANLPEQYEKLAHLAATPRILYTWQYTPNHTAGAEWNNWGDYLANQWWTLGSSITPDSMRIQSITQTPDRGAAIVVDARQQIILWALPQQNPSPVFVDYNPTIGYWNTRTRISVDENGLITGWQQLDSQNWWQAPLLNGFQTTPAGLPQMRDATQVTGVNVLLHSPQLSQAINQNGYGNNGGTPLRLDPGYADSQPVQNAETNGGTGI